jgi:hypothetical protein
MEKGLYARGILRPEISLLPDFLGIGAAKSGATWLYLNLVHHPQVEFAKRLINGKIEPEGPRYQKELRYFRSNAKFLMHSFRSYLRHFEGVPDGVLKGEISPAYLRLELDRIRFLYSVMPELKVMLMARNPVDRAWSQAKMDLVQRGTRRFGDITEQEWIDYVRRPAVIAHGDYKSCLDRYLTVFPREQVFIGLFDDVASSPVELFEGVLAFLGVPLCADYADYPLRKKVGAGTSYPAPPRVLQELYELHETHILSFAEAYSARAMSWLDRSTAGVD